MSFNPNQWFLMGSNQYGGQANTFIGGVSSVINTPALNTFIGGVSSVINTPALLAAKLENYPSGTAFSEFKIYNFTIVGDNIECYIEVDYKQKELNISPSIISILTYWVDLGSKLKYSLGFTSIPNLTWLHLPSCDVVDRSLGFRGTDKLKFLILPECTSLQNDLFYDNSATSAQKYMSFGKVVNYGVDALNNLLFNYFYKPIDIKIHPSMRTVNAGGLEGDLNYASTNGVVATLTDVLDSTKPNKITSITIGTITSTSIDISWVAPSSLNTIERYVIMCDTNKAYTYVGQSTSLTFSITALTTLTTYSIRVMAYDIYGNISEFSDIVNATTI